MTDGLAEPPEPDPAAAPSQGQISLPEPPEEPVTPEIKISPKDSFWIRKQDALVKGVLLDTPPGVREIVALRAVERRYAEGGHRPGLIAPGTVTAVRLTDWVKNVTFDVLAFDESGLIPVTIPFARFYLTSAMWTESDKVIEHFVNNHYFLWPLHAVELFAGYTMDEAEQNVLLDAKNIKDVRAWEYIEEACLKHQIPPSFWSRPPGIWEEQFKQDTEWFGHWIHNRVWGKVYKVDKFLQEAFLVPRDPIFMGSKKAMIDPTRLDQ